MAILNGWKEIAKYIGQSIRTVQRWEEALGLPVHRPRGHSRSGVVAHTEELDAWTQSSPLRFRDEMERLRVENECLKAELAALRNSLGATAGS